ncbi:hypothetical protein HYV72_02045 [Candidatus Uhrbacteria bacterium]|nr:hypothetical protein [Candidatus Uhrbacteria bacterium]
MKHFLTVILFGGLVLAGFGCTKKALVFVDVPSAMRMDGGGVLSVTIENQSNARQANVEVTLPESWTKGIGIRGVAPMASETVYEAKDHVLRYTFRDLMLEKDSSRRIDFTLNAKEEGVFKGRINVCIDDDCTRTTARTTVTAEPSAL